jgi:hypothetical protein
VDVLIDLDGTATLWRARAMAAGVTVLTGTDLKRRLTKTLAVPFAERSRLAREAAQREHGGELLVHRVTRLIGAVAGPAIPGPQPMSCRVLLISSNGAGMGHLTRLVAMARRASAETDVHLLSMSQAVGIAAGGVPFEYVPSSGDLGIGSRRWNRIFERRLRASMTRLRPDVVVFDGAFPYGGLMDSQVDFPETRFVWSRRRMWKPGHGAVQLARAGEFDMVLEPGEVAGDADRGLTASRTEGLRVRPITLLDPADALSRERARAELGLDGQGPAVLVSLGAGNLADVRTERGAVVASLAARPEVQVCVTQPAIAGAAASHTGVTAVSVYPISRYMRAFDAAITTAGYNSFHESVAFSLPTAFVANTTQLDDQQARARWADQHGLGVYLDPREPGSLAAAVEALLDPEQRAAMADACTVAWPGNGASEAMRAVEVLAVGGHPRGAVGGE